MIELKLNQLLKEKTFKEVIEYVVDELASFDVSLQDKETYLNFLIAGGYYQRALIYFPVWLQEASDIPWIQFAETLKRNEIKIPKTVWSALLKLMEDSHFLEQISLDKKWDSLDPIVSQSRKEIFEKVKNSPQEFQNLLRSDIQVAQGKFSFKEGKRAFEEFFQFFPNDVKAQEDFKKFKRKWALRILETEGADQRPLKIQEYSPSYKVHENLFKMIKKSASSKNIYDLALLFMFIDQPKYTVRLLEKRKLSEKEEWLYLEALLESGSLVEALEVIKILQKKHRDNADAQFYLSYVKAQSLKKLGETKKALSLLYGIIKLRPEYRLADSFIKEWESEAE